MLSCPAGCPPPPPPECCSHMTACHWLAFSYTQSSTSAGSCISPAGTHRQRRCGSSPGRGRAGTWHSLCWAGALSFEEHCCQPRIYHERPPDPKLTASCSVRPWVSTACVQRGAHPAGSCGLAGRPAPGAAASGPPTPARALPATASACPGCAAGPKQRRDEQATGAHCQQRCWRCCWSRSRAPAPPRPSAAGRPGRGCAALPAQDRCP